MWPAPITTASSIGRGHYPGRKPSEPARGILGGTSTPRYNCAKCPAYCCTYPRTEVTDADIKRLAKGLGKSAAYVREKYTKVVNGERVLRHKHDEIFETCCKFLDIETRQCTVYKHRPRVCRSYPGTVRCGYYDFLTFERSAQGDPEYIALT